MAQALTQHGFAVAGFDLRGHGRNPGNPEIASFGEEGWEGSLQDMRLFIGLLSQRFSEIPHLKGRALHGSILLNTPVNVRLLQRNNAHIILLHQDIILKFCLCML